MEIRCGDGYGGWREHAPFDVIIVAAAPVHVPQPLIDQLAQRRLVIPVGKYMQELIVIEKQPDGSVKTRFGSSGRLRSDDPRRQSRREGSIVRCRVVVSPASVTTFQNVTLSKICWFNLLNECLCHMEAGRGNFDPVGVLLVFPLSKYGMPALHKKGVWNLADVVRHTIVHYY